MKSCVFRRPSMLRTTLLHSLSANSITSSSISTPFVVSVKLKCLLCVFSSSLPYATSSLHTSQFKSGSPPKKSTSRFLRLPEFSTRKSSACLPTSRDMIPALPLYSPLPAKQYLQSILHPCATWRQIAFSTDCLAFKSPAISSNGSSEKSSFSALSSSISAIVSSTSLSATEPYLAFISSMISSLGTPLSYKAIIS